jgi:hypothetical protein
LKRITKKNTKITTTTPPLTPQNKVGAGTSRLQEGLARSAGYKRVVNVDVSRAAVDMMQQLHAGVPGLEYRVADVR